MPLLFLYIRAPAYAKKGHFRAQWAGHPHPHPEHPPFWSLIGFWLRTFIVVVGVVDKQGAAVEVGGEYKLVGPQPVHHSLRLRLPLLLVPQQAIGEVSVEVYIVCVEPIAVK